MLINLCTNVFFYIIEKKNQRRAIRREFEPIGPTMLKNPLDAGWGLLPTLWWVSSRLFLLQMNISQLNMYLYPKNHLRSQTTLRLHGLGAL